MSKIEIDVGRSSATTHRLTQASTTLNRRYVRRPSNIAVDEAAHAAALREQAEEPRVAPSRLVNLKVHTADLEAAQAAAAAPAEPEVPETPFEPEPAIVLAPNIVEFGRSADELESEPAPMDAALDIEPLSDAPSTSIAETENLTQLITGNDEPVVSSPAPDPTPVEPEIDTARLAASIAADYAAASLGASIREYGDGHDDYAMSNPSGETLAEQAADADAGITNVNPINPEPSNNNSVEAIALAASNAIASIRAATEPDEVSEQVASLKTFADNIKANPSIPEMRELGDTIDKFVNIAMKSSKIKEENECKVAAKVTLSPKVTRAAAKVTKSSAKVMAANRTKATHPDAVASRPCSNTHKVTAARPMNRRPSSSELKSRAIESALETVATMDQRSTATSNQHRKTAMPRKKTGFKRFAIAFTCAALCVAGVISFVGSNMPDISVRVAAMQTGIQAAYPSYVPRDYALGDISSEDGKITMVFQGPDDAKFKLIEEKSSWDSSALLRNYVEPSWGEDYITTHEQGITIYIDNKSSDAAWVNGGVLYKITSEGTALTKKQVRSIVTSL